MTAPIRTSTRGRGPSRRGAATAYVVAALLAIGAYAAVTAVILLVVDPGLPRVFLVIGLSATFIAVMSTVRLWLQKL
ncbi:MAG: hypothetical protein ABL886_14695 [Rhodoglobus sp.]